METLDNTYAKNITEFHELEVVINNTFKKITIHMNNNNK